MKIFNKILSIAVISSISVSLLSQNLPTIQQTYRGVRNDIERGKNIPGNIAQINFLFNEAQDLKTKAAQDWVKQEARVIEQLLQSQNKSVPAWLEEKAGPASEQKVTQLPAGLPIEPAKVQAPTVTGEMPGTGEVAGTGIGGGTGMGGITGVPSGAGQGVAGGTGGTGIGEFPAAPGGPGQGAGTGVAPEMKPSEQLPEPEMPEAEPSAPRPEIKMPVKPVAQPKKFSCPKAGTIDASMHDESDQTIVDALNEFANVVMFNDYKKYRDALTAKLKEIAQNESYKKCAELAAIFEEGGSLDQFIQNSLTMSANPNASLQAIYDGLSKNVLTNGFIAVLKSAFFDEKKLSPLVAELIIANIVLSQRPLTMDISKPLEAYNAEQRNDSDAIAISTLTTFLKNPEITRLAQVMGRTKELPGLILNAEKELAQIKKEAYGLGGKVLDQDKANQAKAKESDITRLKEELVAKKNELDAALEGKDYVGQLIHVLNALRIHPEFLNPPAGMLGQQAVDAATQAASTFEKLGRNPLLATLRSNNPADFTLNSIQKQVQWQVLFPVSAEFKVISGARKLDVKPSEYITDIMPAKDYAFEVVLYNQILKFRKEKEKIDTFALTYDLISRIKNIAELQQGLKMIKNLVGTMPEITKIEAELSKLDPNAQIIIDNMQALALKRVKADEKAAKTADLQPMLTKLQTLITKYQQEKRVYKYLQKILEEAKKRFNAGKGKEYVGAFILEQILACFAPQVKGGIPENQRQQFLVGMFRESDDLYDFFVRNLGTNMVSRVVTKEDFRSWIEPYGTLTQTMKKIKSGELLNEAIKALPTDKQAAKKQLEVTEIIQPFTKLNDDPRYKNKLTSIINLMNNFKIAQALDEITQFVTRSKTGAESYYEYPLLISEFKEYVLPTFHKALLDEVAKVNEGAYPLFKTEGVSFAIKSRNDAVHVMLKGEMAPLITVLSPAELATLNEATIASAIETVMSALQNKMTQIKPADTKTWEQKYNVTEGQKAEVISAVRNYLNSVKDRAMELKAITSASSAALAKAEAPMAPPMAPPLGGENIPAAPPMAPPLEGSDIPAAPPLFDIAGSIPDAPPIEQADVPMAPPLEIPQAPGAPEAPPMMGAAPAASQPGAQCVISID